MIYRLCYLIILMTSAEKIDEFRSILIFATANKYPHIPTVLFFSTSLVFKRFIRYDRTFLCM